MTTHENSRRLGAACVAVCLAMSLLGCGTSTAAPSGGQEAIDLANPYAGIALPLSDYVRAQTGYSQVEISAALLDKKGEVVATCLQTKGYTPRPGDLPSRNVQAGRYEPFGNVTAGALKTLDAMTAGAAAGTSVASSVPTSDAQRAVAVSECFAEARKTPNPLDPFLSWVANYQAEMGARVEADPRVARAAADSKACIQQVGYGVDNEADVSNLLSNKVSAVLAKVQAKSITSEAARGQLELISKEEEGIKPAVLTCLYRRERVRVSVRSELERQFIDDNGPALAEHIALANQNLSAIASYLHTGG